MKPEDKNCVWCTKLITEGRNYRILPDTNKKVPCIFHVRRFGHSDSCHNCQARIDSSETVKVVRRNFDPKNPCKCAKAHKAKANSQDCSTCLKQIAQRGHLTAQIFGVCSCAEPVFKGLYCTNCLGKKPRDCNCFGPVKEIPEKDYCFYCYQTIHPDRDLKQTKDSFPHSSLSISVLLHPTFLKLAASTFYFVFKDLLASTQVELYFAPEFLANLSYF